MKQTEKSQRSYDKIVEAAMEAFGTTPYEATSVTGICKQYQISKGLMYHHFASKEALYLACLEKCFEDLELFMEELNYDGKQIEVGLRLLIDRRNVFFDQHPFHSYLFLQTILQQPPTLLQAIQQIKSRFDELNHNYFQGLLAEATLKPGLTTEEALDYFHRLVEMFQTYYQTQTKSETTSWRLLQERDEKLYEMLNIMLYGIIKEGE